MMKFKSKTITFLVCLGLLLVPYQNCAVYESDGKKALEQLILKNPTSNCLPYLDINAASNIMNAGNVGIYIRFNSAPPTGSVAECDISLQNNSIRAIDNAVCGLSNSYSTTAALQTSGQILKATQSNQILMLNQDPTNFIEVDADPTTSLSGGSFAYSYKLGTQVVLRFLGANNVSSVGLACYMVYNDLVEFQDTTIGKTAGLKRLSDLAHTIVGNLQ